LPLQPLKQLKQPDDTTLLVSGRLEDAHIARHFQGNVLTVVRSNTID
jgi:hypothetical protein